MTATLPRRLGFRFSTGALGALVKLIAVRGCPSIESRAGAEQRRELTRSAFTSFTLPRTAAPVSVARAGFNEIDDMVDERATTTGSSETWNELLLPLLSAPLAIMLALLLPLMPESAVAMTLALLLLLLPFAAGGMLGLLTLVAMTLAVLTLVAITLLPTAATAALLPVLPAASPPALPLRVAPCVRRNV